MFGNIANSSGERLDYSFHEGTAGSRDIVVIGHGVTGNKAVSYTHLTLPTT